MPAGLDTPDIHELRTKHNELLDIIDRLRDADIGRYVELPQIVVVGDQSSGKSSVLEAISRVRFPSKATLCTRFATELVLREEAGPSKVEVTIRVHESETRKEVRQRLEKFTRSQTELTDLTGIIQEATECMGLEGSKNPYSKHTLRVKISGQSIPQLTLVDIPGYYHSGGKEQPIEFQETVIELAAEYMRQESSIVLAVISAKAEFSQQRVMLELKKYDPRGERTLGIVTKPDMLERGALEDMFMGVLRNRRGDSPHFLKHGWHVLRNRADVEDTDFSGRDTTEADLFSNKPWTQIAEKDKGIATLREKLSKILLMHIANKLPHVISRVEQLVKDRQQALYDLGEPRSEISHFFRHLDPIATKFSRLATQAVGGEEKGSEFFGEIKPEGNSSLAGGGQRNLRAHVRNLNRTFIAVLRKYGSKRTVKWHDPGDREVWTLDKIPEDLAELASWYPTREPAIVAQDELERMIHDWAMKSRGTELPGVYDSKMAIALFDDQAGPWKALAARHLELTLEAAETLVTDILTHVTGEDQEMREKLRSLFINPFFRERKTAIEEKLLEILPAVRPNGFGVAMEESFQTRADERAQRRLYRQVDSMRGNANISGEVKAALKDDALFAQNAVNDKDGKFHQWGISRVIDYMVEYYGVSTIITRRFFSILANLRYADDTGELHDQCHYPRC